MFEKILVSIKQRSEYGEASMLPLWGRFKTQTANDLASLNTCYHTECCKEVTNKSKIERTKLRYEKKNTTDDTTKDNNSEGTIEENFSPIDSKTPRKSLRSNGPEHDKNLCIICQKEGGKLHNVEFLQTGPKMLRVAKDLPDPSFFLRMNSIPNADDAVANDVKYHLNCWVLAQRSAVKCNVELMQEMNDIDRILADIEIVNIVNHQLNVIGDAVLDMKNINTTYNNLLTTSDNPQNFKRYLKQLLMDHIPNITFTRPPARNEPERVLSFKSGFSKMRKVLRIKFLFLICDREAEFNLSLTKSVIGHHLHANDEYDLKHVMNTVHLPCCC